MNTTLVLDNLVRDHKPLRRPETIFILYYRIGNYLSLSYELFSPQAITVRCSPT
jgi:hypothetical protein